MFHLESIPGNFITSRKWKMEASEAQCDNEDYMNLGFQLTLRTCAAICDLKQGNAFAYGVQGKKMCQGPCSCKCWYSCAGFHTDRPADGMYHLYKFIENTPAQTGMHYRKIVSNFVSIYDVLALEQIKSFTME